MSSTITLRGICKNFGDTRALVDADLETSLGEIHAIVGENGSGKSTLAKIISGVIAPDTGSVDVLGIHPKSPSEAIAGGISTIYQEIMLAEDLSIQENIFAGSDSLFKKRYSTRDKNNKTIKLLERLTLSKINPEARVSEQPLNKKQWIVIARALLQKPKLLIFDESSAALDLEATNRLHQEMKLLQQNGSCVVLVTHRIAELVKIADSATVLRDGKSVGRLAKADITEANLLDLMSASKEAIGAASQRRVVSTAQKTVLSATAVKTRARAESVDFRIDAGQIVGIVGLDGAGHAEFVRMLAGIENPVAGCVTVNDSALKSREITSLSQAENSGITYVSGDRKRVGIFPNLSIEENFGLSLHDRFGDSILVDEAASLLAFEEEVERLKIKYGKVSDKITTLSGGNQQKVLIARAFARRPKVIVLNDPARGVDIGTKQELYRQLHKFASNGGAVVYLSSEIEELFDFVDRADVFFNGSIFSSYTGADINEKTLLSAMFGHKDIVEFDGDLVENGQHGGSAV